MPITKLEEKILNESEWRKAFKHITWLVNEVPGRYAGSEDEVKSANYIQRTLCEYGVSAKQYEVDAYLGVPVGAKLHIREPEKKAIEASPRVSSSVPITGELLLIESKEEAGERNRDIAGKVVLAPYSYGLPISPEDVHARGGKGMILGNWGPSDLDVLRVTAPQTWIYWGVPTPEIFRVGEGEALPQIFVGRKSYEVLRDLCRKNTVKVTFESSISSKWAKTHMVVGEVESPNRAEDFVLLGSHHDSWSPGASDDAAGVGMMIELARVFQNNRGHLTRNIRFAFVSGHENGAYATSTWYLDNFWGDINDHAVCFAVYDTPGFKNAPEYKLEVSEELSDFATECARDIVGNDVVLNVHRANKTADRGFFGIGIPSIYTRNAFSRKQIDEWRGAFLGYWNHSAHDTIDKIGQENFVQNMRIRALETFRLCSMDLIPYNFIRVAEAFKKRLEGWEDISGFDLDPTRKYVNLFHERLQALYKALEGRQFGERELNEANSILKRLARVITPINYTTKGRYGQDIFGTDLSKPLVALKDVDELPTSEEGSPKRIMLLTKLLRERNRVNDALREAVSMIDSFLKR
jgi:hypothetical protein